MSKNIVIALGIVLIVVIVGAIILTKKGGDSTASTSSTPIVQASIEVSAVPVASEKPATLINYTDKGFDPANVTIKKGDTVVWTNNSAKDFWPASGMHPTHLLYPEQTSCFAGVFNNCNIAPGKTYTMQFNIVGAWGFHDHLKPANFGKITVTE